MTLSALFQQSGFTSAQVAARLANAFGRVDPLLFERIDQDRQPLPNELVQSIANLIDVDQWDVRSAASKLTTSTGRLSRVPLPPILGDEFQATLYALPPDEALDLPFTPGQILGQQLFGWFRSDLDILTTPPDVTDWGDQGPAGNDLDEALFRPVYFNDGSGVNDLPFLRFAEADSDEMEFPIGGIAGTSDLSWTFIFAVNPTVITGAQEGNLFTVWTGAADEFSIAHEIDVGTNLGYFNNAVWTSIAPATTGMQILAFVFDEAAAECRVYRNKVLLGTGPYVPFDITPGGFVQIIGGSSTRLGAPTRSPDMDLYEVACYGQPIDVSTPDEWNRLHSEYLFTRYSLP